MEVSMSKTRRGKYTDNRICYISKCKGDMRLYLRRKGKLPCFSTLCEGNHFRFIEERYEVFGKFLQNRWKMFGYDIYLLKEWQRDR